MHLLEVHYDTHQSSQDSGQTSPFTSSPFQAARSHFIEFNKNPTVEWCRHDFNHCYI